MNSLPTIDGLHSAESLTPALFDSIFHCAERIEADPQSFVDSLRGKIIGTIFHEPSTRTRLSFESAAQKMGGGIISIADPQTTSEAKGESLADMIRVVSSYADVLVLRHSRDGASRYASRFSSVPIINGGDGRLGHPTQTLVDLYTLHKSWEGDFADKTVGLMGDLKNGRTVRSLAWSLASLGARFVVLPVPGLDWEASFEQRIVEYFDMRMRFVSHPLFEKWTGNQEARVIEPKGLVQKELFGNTVPKMDSLDALYLTRIQAERGANASGPFTGVNSEIYTGDGGIKAQMKYADRRNSPAVILYGENEAKSGTVTIKNLNVGKKSSEEIKTREDWKSNESAQTTVKFENLLDEIKKIIKSN